MKTVVIKVLDPVDEKYRVELYVDDGSETWDEKPRFYSFMPQDLSSASPVLDSFDKPITEASAKNDFKLGNARNFRKIGKYLYRLLFQGQVKKEWEGLKRRYPGKPQGAEGLRTILDIQQASLRALPWELIGEKSFLFLDAANPFSRGKIPFKKDVTPHQWPLRALIIVGSKQDDPAIDAELEVESIVGPLREASRTIEVDILRRPSIDDVGTAYRIFQPHIVHFIGHGGKTGNQPYLWLYDDKGKPQGWTVDDIRNLENTGWTASFAFINACRAGDKTGVDESQKIASAFVAAGVPAVLFMQGDIKEEAAQTLAASVYEALAEGTPLDQAVARGRFEVSNSKNKYIGLNTNQWALSSLFLSVPPDKVLEMNFEIEERVRTLIKEDGEFGQLQTFVDRLKPRLDISTTVDPRGLTPGKGNLLIVKGISKVGKSSMVKLCLECCAMRGRRCTWVNAEREGERSKTFLEVLRAIRDGNPSLNSMLSPSLDEQGAFSQFNWALTQLLQPKKSKPTKTTAPANYKETSTLNISEMKGDPESVAYLFSTFRDGLQKAAGNVPLVIVLDNMEINPEHFNDVLIPHLIQPVKRGDVSNVKIVLVLSQKNETEYKGLQKLGQYKPIEVSSFKPDEFIPLTLEYLRYNKDLIKITRDEVMGIVKAVDKTIKQDWEPKYLETVLAVVIQ